mgnify:CR=1 FL=1
MWLTILVNIVPLVIALMKIAEQAFSEPGTGADKKSFVMQAGQMALSAVKGFSTAG